MTTETTVLPKTINAADYHVRLTVDITPDEAFNNINDVSKWWTENLEGSSQNVEDEFSVQFGDIHFSKHKIIELIPNRKVTWLVTDSNLSFLEDKQEWTNTKIIFEISSHDNKTVVDFTHIGLAPGVECYEKCVKGWDYYINGSLASLLTQGKGKPALKVNE